MLFLGRKLAEHRLEILRFAEIAIREAKRT
jgi:hypothetical protein